MIHSTYIFVIVLGVLIFFHELGHFLMARLFGVGVEKFSLGFGPRLLGKTIGRTDYRLSAIPLGGYVKMVGEEPDKEIDPEDLPFSFTHKHVAKRSLIVAAGPIFNALLAVLIFSVVLFFTGLPSIRPIIRNVEADSPAAKAGLQAGDRVRAIDGQAIGSWRDIDERIEKSKGRTLQLELLRQGDVVRIAVAPQRVTIKNLFGDSIEDWDLGIARIAEIRAIVGGLVKDMPAAKAGLQVGDHVVAINGEPIDRWQTMLRIVSDSKGKPLVFKIQRGSDTLEVEITPALVQEKNQLGVKQNAYRIGIQAHQTPIPDADQFTVELNIFQAVGQGISATAEMTRVTVYFFGKLFQGKVPMESLGGPIRIAQMASKEADKGLIWLLNFIAIISIQLAILNLLPIPVLDGGHLLFYGIEAVLRRPVKTRTRETAQQIGIFILLLLMIFVFYNDIMSTWFR
jgi:regulator of sigma E protease